MSNPTPQEVHVDKFLTTLSVAYTQQAGNFVAGKVFPFVPVKKQSDKYVVYDKGTFYRSAMGPRPLGDTPNRSSYKTSSDSYICEEYAEEQVIDDRQRANTDDPLDPDRDATNKLTQSALIFTDQSWSAKFFSASPWTTNYAGVSSAPSTGEFLQFDQAGSKPISFIRNAIRGIQRTTGYKPNVGVFGVDVFEVLINHVDVIDRVKYTALGIADNELLAKVLGLETVLVAESVANAAAEGVADSIDFICSPKGFLLAYSAPNPSLLTPSAGYIFVWTGLIPGHTPADGVLIQKGYDTRSKSTWIQGRCAWDMKVVAPDLGTYFADAVG
jgi:hypothetical protein